MLVRLVTTLIAVAFVVGTGTAASQAQNGSSARDLLHPETLNETAPETFKALFETSVGSFVVRVTRAWAPLGADRFYNLVKAGFYDDTRFFRVIDGFMVQFGINGNPSVMKAWRPAMLADDPVKESNTRGYVTFASGGSKTRTTQVFINFGNNANLDRPGACGPGCAFPPFGKVVTGMDVVDK